MSTLANLRLVPENEDEDLYSGFDDDNPLYDTTNLGEDQGFIQAVKTSHGRRPPMTALKGASGIASNQGGPTLGFRANLASSMGRVHGDAEAGPRPMTSVTGAGFSAKRSLGGGVFDPLNQAIKGISGTSTLMESLDEVTPEDKIKAMERQIHELLDQSAIASKNGDHITATDKAKEAGKKERQLVRQRDQSGLSEGISVELTYAVLFNLAVQYEGNEMYPEALNTYNVIVKNKMFQSSGRIRVNIGNIYFKQGNLAKAIKNYRMALDQVPTTHKEVRIRIMQNIGGAFVKLGQFNDAITSYEHIISEKPDFQSALNLILCYVTIGDKDKMCHTFQRMLTVNLGIEDEDKYSVTSDNPQESVFLDAIRNDPLRQLERRRKLIAERCILTGAKVIAPAIKSSFSEGFDWVIEQVKASQYHDLANDLEIHKALMYLKESDFSQAVGILKTFEKKDTLVKAQAATDLSFIYFVQGNIENARRYADASVKADRFNSAALTNKGNCLYQAGNAEDAVVMYKEALENDSSCHEALYNMGLVHKRMGNLDESLDCFLKLHNIVRGNAEVMYQIASLYEQMEDWTQAMEWLMQCIGVAPNDASILGRMADICERDDGGDRSQAFAYRLDSYKLFPADINTIEWLGSYYIDSQFSEKAIEFFERAAVVQPNEVKWRLMVASCFRRSGNYQAAFEKYKQINKKFPENVECLKNLNRLCSDLGLNTELKEYANKLRKAERTLEARAQRGGSATKRGKSHKIGNQDDSSNDSRNNSASAGGSARRRKPISEITDHGNNTATNKPVDASYNDPLGPAMERPKTAARTRNETLDTFDDVEIDENLLPD